MRNTVFKIKRLFSYSLTLLLSHFFTFLLSYFILCSLFSVTAWAKFYSYIDRKGCIHITNKPSNPKYRLITRSGENDHDFLISELARKHGLDPALVKAVIKVESNFDSAAISRRGAQGLMQLMPRTARELRVGDVWDPYHNIEGGARYLRKMLNRFSNNLSLALAAYNAGPNKVKHGKIPPYPETRRFVREVVNYYHYYRVEEDSSHLSVDKNGHIYLTGTPLKSSFKRIY